MGLLKKINPTKKNVDIFTSSKANFKDLLKIIGKKEKQERAKKIYIKQDTVKEKQETFEEKQEIDKKEKWFKKTF